MAVAPKPSSTAKWCGSRALAVSTIRLASQRRLFSTGASLHGANRHRGRYRQAAGRDGAVGQHQQHRTFAHLAFRFVAQGANGLLQILLLRIEGQIERLGAIVFAFQRGELFEIGVQQDRRFEAQAVRPPSASQNTFISRPMLVASDMTCASRSGSIGGLVTCANCWRK